MNWKQRFLHTSSVPSAITFSDFEVLEPKTVTAHWIDIPQFSGKPYKADWMTHLPYKKEVELLENMLAKDRPSRVVITSPDNNFFPCILVFEDRVFVSYGSVNNVMSNERSFVFFLSSIFRSGVDVYYGALRVPTKEAIRSARLGEEKRFTVDKSSLEVMESSTGSEIGKLLRYFQYGRQQFS